LKKRLDAILIIIIINGLFYAVTYLLPDNHIRMVELFGLYLPLNENFGVWQFITSMFMHGGFTHLLFNMYALWAFGTPLEQMWGVKRFVFFYFAAGLGAGVIYTVINYLKFTNYRDALIANGVSENNVMNFLETGKPDAHLLSSTPAEQLISLHDIFSIPAVGASGAIYGVLVAFGMLFPNAKLALIFLPVPIPAKYFIPGLIALDLFSGVTGVSIFGGGIAHFAHVGGAIIGFLLMWWWKWRKPETESTPFV
jgi:membrane associated rhomboid family serine protease